MSSTPIMSAESLLVSDAKTVMSKLCNDSNRISQCAAWALLSSLALIAFWPLVLSPTKMLYSDHSDMLAMHVPMKHFLVHSFQKTGQMPYWCPSSFAGLPFVHDVQLAAFYPLHWPLYWLNPDTLGAAVSWLIVLHVIIAGCGMFCYARSTSLSWYGSLAAAGGWMFAGKWMMHMVDGGHSILAPLAWLPCVLCCLQYTRLPGSCLGQKIAWSVASGLVFGMMVLGTHPQIMFYSGVAVALRMLVAAMAGESTLSHRRPLRSEIGYGVICIVIAAGLGAIQLLPAIESTPETSRAGGVSSADILPGGIRVLINMIGPAIVATNASGGWEDRGGFAVVTFFLAFVAVATRRKEAFVRQHLWMCAILIAYAMGMAMLFQWLPGFRLFRQATRMILIAALPMAWLAGAGVESLATMRWNPRLPRSIAIRIVVVTAILCGGLAIRGWVSGETLRWHHYWASLLVTVPLMFWLFNKTEFWSVTARLQAWSCLMIVDAMMLAVPSVAVKSFAEVYHAGTIVKTIAEISQPGDRILDRDASDDSYAAPFGTGAPLALLHQFEPVRGYNSFDLASYRRYLKRICGDPSPLQPFQDAWTYPLVGDFPIRDQSLVDLLGVRYLVAPAHREFPHDWQPMAVAESSAKGYSVIDGGIVSLPEYRVYENTNAYPKVWTADAEYITPSDASDVTLSRVLAKGKAAIQPAQLIRYEPNQIIAKVTVDKPSLFVLNDAYFPGWVCQVDGQAQPIVRVEGLFRGVWLTPDANEVRFLFQPQSLRRGRWISLLTLIFAVAVIGILRIWTPRKRIGDQPVFIPTCNPSGA